MRILLWHVHAAWATAFVQGPHEYLIPVTPDRDKYGLGRPETYPWPVSATEVAADRLASQDVDVVVAQRPEELELAERWLGRRPGRDVPAVFVEHNTPKGEVPNLRHPLADRDDIPVVHVTHFNELFWDNGIAPTTVIEHGIVDPGYRYTGELARSAVVINEPIRRWRVTGTDLLPAFAQAAPVDVFGMKAEGLPGRLGIDPRAMGTYDLPQGELHAEMARRRVYVHPNRWTSLGLSLLEAMHLGMPVVALAATEVAEAVPEDAGVVSTKVSDLVEAVRRFIADPLYARQVGKQARDAALTRYGLARFLADWDRLLAEVVR
ncbi:glycosyltransferase [Bailinhaonella thermotolerans]|uniref:Glycosyltransferase n=1 Tax=Bailinhaonella thermotolerans TaxID=1070861 RepID=A0A3A4B2T2_9ACTN|nr:glycosyltransferase [Bailinhaonella thermotolerans]RJL32485.1 glycosyltransferase [Bailinhaonella thermotolerans]